jgi:hypothetical protein
MAKGKKTKRERRERRFLPASAGNPTLVKALGGLGAAALGAGTWAEFGRSLMNIDLPPYAFAPYVLSGGALLFGAAVWLGTTSEPPVRVGAGGIAIEKNELVRIPWHSIQRIVWEQSRGELRIRAKDESGRDTSLVLTARTHPLAAAWVAREARERIPSVTDVPDAPGGLPETHTADGESLLLDPVQVVGRHCASSGRVIAYEPDARVCPRCELVYHKESVPEECTCGASLASLRSEPESKASAATSAKGEAAPTGGEEAKTAAAPAAKDAS